MNDNYFDVMRVIRKISEIIPIRVRFFIAYSRRIFCLCMIALTVSPCIAVAQENHRVPAPQNQTGLQTFQDWSVHCVDVAPAVSAQQSVPTQTACEAAQTVTIVDGGQKVEILKLAMSPAKDKAAKSHWALIALFPLDVSLTADFGLSAGSGKPALYRFRNCNHLGCFGVVPLDKAMLTRFAKTPDAAVYFRLLTGKAVKVVFSLKGFGPAFDALQSRAMASERHSGDPQGSAK